MAHVSTEISHDHRDTPFHFLMVNLSLPLAVEEEDAADAAAPSVEEEGGGGGLLLLLLLLNLSTSISFY